MHRIVHLQQIAEQLSDAFTDVVKITKSYIPTANVLDRVIVPKEQLMKNVADELSMACHKSGRSISSKDNIPKKRKVIK